MIGETTGKISSGFSAHTIIVIFIGDSGRTDAALTSRDAISKYMSRIEINA
jgi:hypothetical protein